MYYSQNGVNKDSKLKPIVQPKYKCDKCAC